MAYKREVPTNSETARDDVRNVGEKRNMGYLNFFGIPFGTGRDAVPRELSPVKVIVFIVSYKRNATAMIFN